MTDDSHSIENRIARFSELEILDVQKNQPLPQEVADMIWSRQLLPVITRADDTASGFGNSAPIRGAGDISITYAVCPAGTGPTYHAHRRTFETFTVVQGECEFSTYKNAVDEPVVAILKRFDVLSVPPMYYRSFRAISNEDVILQVIITGGAHDADDIFFPESTAQRIATIDPKHLVYLQGKGFYFEGVPAGKSRKHS